MQELLSAVAASALKLDFAALQPRCACFLCVLAPLRCLLIRCCRSIASAATLPEDLMQVCRASALAKCRALTLATVQGLPLEQGGSASQAVTALAAEVRENVKLRQIRWCVCESRLYPMVAQHTVHMC